MTHRERILATIRREPTDAVPISTYELVGFGPWGWPVHEPSYAPLMREIIARAVSLPLWGAWCEELTPTPSDRETWQEGDFTVTRTTLHTPQGDLYTTSKETPSVKTVWTTEHLCKTREDIDRWFSMPITPGPVHAEGFAALDAEVGDHGIVLCDIADPICHIAPLFEFGEFTVWAMEEPELIRAMCDRVFPRILHTLRGMLDAGCGPLYRLVGAEYCTPPYLPPRLFREFVTPYLQEMLDLLHAHGCYGRVHCHGNIRHVLDDLCAIGTDAIDPVEPPPDGDIPLAEVKARYGDRLVLFGNMELKYLETETPADIDARVRAMMDDAKAGGGFVLMPTAAPINVPLSPQTAENYLAYLAAGEKYGRY
jgi:hypothetical protein